MIHPDARLSDMRLSSRRSLADEDLLALAGKRVVCGIASFALVGALVPTSVSYGEAQKVAGSDVTSCSADAVQQEAQAMRESATGDTELVEGQKPLRKGDTPPDDKGNKGDENSGNTPESPSHDAAPISVEVTLGSQPIPNEGVVSEHACLVIEAKGDGLRMDDQGRLDAQAELLDGSGSDVAFAGAWERKDGEGSSFVLRTAEELLDGTYSLQVRVRNTDDEETTVAATFCVDTNAPKASMAGPWEEAFAVGDTLYFNHGVAVRVRVEDPTLDESRTTVDGIALATLLAGSVGESNDEGVRYDQWTSDVVDGKRVCEGVVHYAEGMFAPPVVRAWDAAGNALDSSAEDVRRELGVPATIVVDTKAPVVRPTLNNVPSFVLDDEPGGAPIAFFNRQTVLDLHLDDESGIRSLELVNAHDATVRHELTNVSDDKKRAQVVLAAGPLTNDVEIVVCDMANNVTRWSLHSRGPRVVADEVTDVENEPLVHDGTHEPITHAGHPAKLIEDTLAPSLAFEGIREGENINAAHTLSLLVEDATHGYVATRDAEQVLLSVRKDGVEQPLLMRLAGYDGALVRDTRHTYDVPIVADCATHATDGSYVATATARDMAGNVSTMSRSFVVDTTRPALEVAYDDVRHEGAYYRGSRVATVRLAERNLSAEQLNDGELVRMAVQARDGHVPQDVSMSPWHEDGTANTYVRTVTFPADGTYSLRIEGTDVAGNPLEGAGKTTVSEGGLYESGEFTIDTATPSVACAYAQGSAKPQRIGNLDCFRQPVTVDFFITDRNLDLGNTMVVDSAGNEVVPPWRLVRCEADGNKTYTASMTYCEEEPLTGAGRKSLAVHAVDMAGNEVAKVPLSFVVDQTAPAMERVSASKPPVAVERDGAGSDPVLFYNGLGGIPARLSFLISDEYGLDSIWVDDPDKVYDVRRKLVGTSKVATLDLTLRDLASSQAQNTDFERNVLVHIRDVAGNERVWSLDRTGKVLSAHDAGAQNVALDGGTLHPLALVCDTTQPVVRIEGVDQGTYYNTPQTARLVVTEHNLDYVRRFDPNRTVATIYAEQGVEGGSTSVTPIRARDLNGVSPVYELEHTLELDGHYRIEAQVEDMAANRSELVAVGTFTVDQTPPAIQVTWDNVDARNGRYYRAPRTATITVIEHNFDPALMSIQTTGSVGTWSSAGDVHTCTVSFMQDAPDSSPATLRIAGRDLAGNEAMPFVEPDFVIDTQAPHVRFGKRVSDDELYEVSPEVTELKDGMAFCRGMAPVVEFWDEANFDLAGVEVRLLGKRNDSSTAIARDALVVPQGTAGAHAEWGNLGLADDGTGPRYLMDADDVYTIEARVTDKAGNASQVERVVFSVNRFGSNFFVEGLDGLDSNDGDGQSDAPLPQAPRIVVHEINVSGAEEGDHLVTKEHAFATSELPMVDSGGGEGYVLASSTEASACNPYEGWSEYVYTINAANFGQGSSSDHGDGGQGAYRVDVSSRDRARNNNTTASFWESAPTRLDRGVGVGPASKSATVAFTLDERGPAIEDVDVPRTPVVGRGYTASFRIVDAITEGDRVRVTVDGEPVPVFREGSNEPVGEGESVRQGTYTFPLGARSLFDAREVRIHVDDYTGMASREQDVVVSGVRVSTMATEGAIAVAVGAACALLIGLMRHRRRISEPSKPTRA